MGLMAAFHDDWRLSIRVITPLPLLNMLVYWLVLSPQGRNLAEETRKRTSAGIETDPTPTFGDVETRLPHVRGLRGSVIFEEPPSPRFSLFSYPGSFQLPFHFLSLHPDIDQSRPTFEDVLQRFGCPPEQDEDRGRTMPMRPPTPMFGRLVSHNSFKSSRLSRLRQIISFLYAVITVPNLTVKHYPASSRQGVWYTIHIRARRK
jgi:hypothetical protein